MAVQTSQRLTSNSFYLSKPKSESEILARQKVLAQRLNTEKVSFSNITLDEEDIMFLSGFLKKKEFFHITSLNFHNTELSDTSVGVLTETIKGMRDMKELVLSDNALTARGIFKLSTALQSGEIALKSLSLEDNDTIEGNGILLISNIIANSTTLCYLNLSSILLNRKLKVFIAGIKSSSTLERLILENTRLDGDYLKTFIDELCKEDNKCRLKELNLSYNQNNNYTVYTELFQHDNFNKLEKLSLCCAHANESTVGRNSPANVIYRSMSGNRSIKELYLRGNDLQTRDCRKLGSLMTLKSNLEVLDLTDNNIELTGAIVLSTAIANVHNLHDLRLDGNRFLNKKKGIEIYNSMKEALRQKNNKNNESISFRPKQRNKPSRVQTKLSKNIFKTKSGSRAITGKSGGDKLDSTKYRKSNRFSRTSSKFLKRFSKFSTKSKDKPVPNQVDNLDDDWTSVQINEAPVKQIKIANKGSNNLDDEVETCFLVEDDDDSVIFDSDNEGKSVVEDTDFKTNKQARASDVKTRCPERLFDNNSDKDSARASNRVPGNWEYSKVSKSEVGFLAQVKKMQNKKKRNEKCPVSILDLSEDTMKDLSKMLSAFENLLDREENLNTVFVPKKKKERPFVKKFGVIGHLGNRDDGGSVDYTLAKSIIDRKLVTRQLVRNVTLLNQFAKLRREIGSGVPTKIGGMLPSILMKKLVTGKYTVGLSIDLLESYASTVLLMKVVLWSIFKAFAISKPSVDPQGRHMLEEFGKAIIEKDDEDEEYKSKSKEYTKQKRAKLGQYIISGAVQELVDLLVLLRPMFAISEALYATVASNNPQPKLSYYEALHRIEERKAKKKVGRKYEKTKKIETINATLKRAKKSNQNKDDKEVESPEEVIKKKQNIKAFLDKVDEIKRHTQNLRNKKKRKKSLKVEKKIILTPEILKYRQNCPERVNNVVTDLRVETESLLTILSVDDFLPMLLSFCNYTETVGQYQSRVEKVLETLPKWVKKLSSEFKVEMLDHFAPAVAPQVEKDVKPKKNFLPKELLKKERNNESSELGKVFNKLRKKNEGVTMKEVSLEEETEEPAMRKLEATEDESFFNPIVNRLFSARELSVEGSKKIREVVRKRLNDNINGDRLEFVSHLQNLCANGCTQTISTQTLEAREKFANATSFL